jgi:integrase/recombinase XerC
MQGFHVSTELMPVPNAEPPATAPIALAPIDLFEAWQGGKKPSTREGYYRDLKDFARFLNLESPGAAVGQLLQLEAGPANGVVLSYRNRQLERKLSAATISRRLAAIRSVVKLARTLGRVNWSIEIPAPPAEARRDMSGPNPDEMKQLLRVIRTNASTAAGKRDRAAVFMMFGLGLRRGEVVALDLADVDFAGSSLRVLRKGKREKETLSMPEPTARALESWVVARGTEPGPLIGLSGNGLWRAISQLGKAAGLARGLWPHSFRHAATTVAESRTEKDFEVIAFTGHAKLQTAGRYLDAKREAQARIARLVAKDLKL